MTIRSLKSTALLSLLALCAPAAASASSLVYTPVNPNFGGNPQNGIWLQSQAALEKPPGYTPQTNQQSLLSSLGAGAQTFSPGQQFAQQLTSQLYASLANQITTSIFGPSAVKSGTTTFQGTTITWSPGANGNINITVNDGQTITTVSVPSN